MQYRESRRKTLNIKSCDPEIQAHWGKCLPNTYEALGLISSTHKTQCGSTYM